MKCLAALVGRVVQELPNGTFNLIEGGIAEFTLAELPATLYLAGVFRFEFTADEAAQSVLHHLHTEIMLNGVALGPEQVLPMLLTRDPSYGPSYFNALLNFELRIGVPGLLRIVTRIDGFGGAPSVDVVIKTIPRSS